MSTSSGQKVNDPHSVISEAPGIVTNDSVAADSVKSGGSFGAGNPKVGVSSQPSDSTTTNTTDTSAASVLDAAPNAEAREAQAEWSENAQLNAGAGLAKDSGVGPTYSTPSETKDGSSHVATAPSYASVGKLHEKDMKPHGKNLTEGDIPDSAPNASFNNAIGTKDDPGRVAEQQFQRHAAQSGHDAGFPRQKEGVSKSTGEYDVLKDEEA